MRNEHLLRNISISPGSAGTPLGRLLNGSSLPEDIEPAKAQLSQGLKAGVDHLHAEALRRLLRGSQLAEDLTLGGSALRDILSRARSRPPFPPPSLY